MKGLSQKCIIGEKKVMKINIVYSSAGGKIELYWNWIWQRQLCQSYVKTDKWVYGRARKKAEWLMDTLSSTNRQICAHVQAASRHTYTGQLIDHAIHRESANTFQGSSIWMQNLSINRHSFSTLHFWVLSRNHTYAQEHTWIFHAPIIKKMKLMGCQAGCRYSRQKKHLQHCLRRYEELG